MGGSSDFALARYLPNGTSDASFGQNGKTSDPVLPGDDIPRAGEILAFGTGGKSQEFGRAQYSILTVALQSDGKTVAGGGSRTIPSGQSTVTLLRYDSKGKLDPLFGSGGKVTNTMFADSAAAGIAIRPDNKIVVAVAGNGSAGSVFGLARYK